MCRVRTSSGAFLKTGHDEIVREIENKISDFTFIPVGNVALLLTCPKHDNSLYFWTELKKVVSQGWLRESEDTRQFSKYSKKIKQIWEMYNAYVIFFKKFLRVIK